MGSVCGPRDRSRQVLSTARRPPAFPRIPAHPGQTLEGCQSPPTRSSTHAPESVSHDPIYSCPHPLPRNLATIDTHTVAPSTPTLRCQPPSHSIAPMSGDPPRRNMDRSLAHITHSSRDPLERISKGESFGRHAFVVNLPERPIPLESIWPTTR